MTTGPTQGHCKSLRHLRVTAVAASKADVASGITAEHLDKMPCQANAPQNGPGVLLSDANHKSGLKLLPDAVAGLPLLLRAAASQGHSVLLEHTGGRVFYRWDSFTNAEALTVAAAIEGAA